MRCSSAGSCVLVSASISSTRAFCGVRLSANTAPGARREGTSPTRDFLLMVDVEQDELPDNWSAEDLHEVSAELQVRTLSTWGMLAALLAGMVLLGAVTDVVWQIRALLRDMSRSSPFTPRNVRRVRRIGVVLLAVGVGLKIWGLARASRT